MKRESGHDRAGSRRRAGADAASRSARRRSVLAAVAWSPLWWIGTVFAQAKQKPVVIGWLQFGSREVNLPRFMAFKEGLAALGYKEGQQYVIEARWAYGRRERVRPLAEELAAMMPAVIVAAPNPTVAAAANAAPMTPIVQATGGDPVLAGLAKSLARPGGMVTGLSNVVSEISEKYLEFLIALTPRPQRVGVLGSSTRTAGGKALREAVLRSAEHHSVDARIEEATKPEDIEAAISGLAKQGVQALVVLPTQLLSAERGRIVKLALVHRWPVLGFSREWPESGAVLSYGVDVVASYHRAAYFVDRILKGAKPGDLQIEQPTKIELVVNMKAARDLGVSVPQSILLRADRVIE